MLGRAILIFTLTLLIKEIMRAETIDISKLEAYFCTPYYDIWMRDQVDNNKWTLFNF